MDHQQNAAKTLAAQIEGAASKVSERLGNDTVCSRKSSITSDDMSKALSKFLDEVDDVQKLPGNTAIAFSLVMTIGEHSHGDLDSDEEIYEDRPSGEVVDDLLQELAAERKDLEPL